MSIILRPIPVTLRIGPRVSFSPGDRVIAINKLAPVPVGSIGVVGGLVQEDMVRVDFGPHGIEVAYRCDVRLVCGDTAEPSRV